MLGLASATGINPNFLSLAIVLTLTLGVGFAIYLIYSSTANLIDIAVLFSPAGLLFQVIDTGSVGRKDLVPIGIMVAGSLTLIRFQKRKFGPEASLALSVCLMAIGILVHETVIFYAAPLFLLHYGAFVRAGRADSGLILSVSGSLVLAFIFSIIASSPAVSPETVAAICARLSVAAPNACTDGDGAIGWLTRDAHYGIETVKLAIIDGNYMSIYRVSFSMTLIYTLVYSARFKYIQSGEGSRKDVLLLNPFVSVCLAFIATLPLYVIAVDWGRWLSVFFIHATIYIKVMERTGVYSLSDRPSSVPWAQNVMVFGLAVSSLFWSVSVCCTTKPSLAERLTYYFGSSFGTINSSHVEHKN